jgi:hypothetical protein
MPVLNVDIIFCGWWENESTKEERHFKQPSTKSDWIQVHADQEYTLMVQLERVNRARDLKVHSPRFPRGKDEGWFLTLGNIESRELMALKRVSAVRGSRKCQQLTFFTPKTTGKNLVENKYCISSPIHFFLNATQNKLLYTLHIPLLHMKVDVNKRYPCHYLKNIISEMRRKTLFWYGLVRMSYTP